VTSSINTNSRVDVLASGPNCFLEAESIRVLFVLKLIPNILSEALGEERFGSWREYWKTSKIVESGACCNIL